MATTHHMRLRPLQFARVAHLPCFLSRLGSVCYGFTDAYGQRVVGSCNASLGLADPCRPSVRAGHGRTRGRQPRIPFVPPFSERTHAIFLPPCVSCRMRRSRPGGRTGPDPRAFETRTSRLCADRRSRYVALDSQKTGPHPTPVPLRTPYSLYSSQSASHAPPSFDWYNRAWSRVQVDSLYYRHRHPRVAVQAGPRALQRDRRRRDAVVDAACTEAPYLCTATRRSGDGPPSRSINICPAASPSAVFRPSLFLERPCARLCAPVGSFFL